MLVSFVLYKCSVLHGSKSSKFYDFLARCIAARALDFSDFHGRCLFLLLNFSENLDSRCLFFQTIKIPFSNFFTTRVIVFLNPL